MPSVVPMLWSGSVRVGVSDSDRRSHEEEPVAVAFVVAPAWVQVVVGNIEERRGRFLLEHRRHEGVAYFVPPGELLDAGFDRLECPKNSVIAIAGGEPVAGGFVDGGVQ